MLLAMQEELYNDRYDAAEQQAQALNTAYPHDPLGCLFTAITLVTAAYDAEEPLRGTEFHALLDTAETLAREQVKTSNLQRRAWGFLALGHVESYRAVWEARFGSKITAARKGRAAAEHYERGLRADSTVYDLYFGLGLYHYWKSAKSGVLGWLGLIADDKRKGISELQLAAESSLVSREAARSALIWVRLDREEHDETIALARNMLRRYPESRSLLWPLAEAYYDSERYADAAATYGQLRERLAKNPGNYYNLIECDYRLARCYEHLGMPGEWAKAAREVSAYLSEVSNQTRDRQRERIEYLGKSRE